MKAGLLQDLGVDNESTSIKPLVLQYVRQQMLKRATPPAQREILTIATVADLLLKARPASAMDVLLQRLKSQEISMSGTHWAIAQRLELVGPDGLTITGVEELGMAKKDHYVENRVKGQSNYPDTRTSWPSKGGAKGREDRKDQGKGTKGKGGKGGKNDAGAKKDDTATK